MSILIEGMEMPKHCGECPLLDWVSGECLASAVRDNNYFKPTLRVDGFTLDANGNKIRHKDCLLIELPTPHGRLIDADLATEKLATDKKEVYTKHDVWLKFSTYGAPTVIEREE